jgi:hypothetical protein
LRVASGQPFIRLHNETLCVVAMRVSSISNVAKCADSMWGMFVAVAANRQPMAGAL